MWAPRRAQLYLPPRGRPETDVPDALSWRHACSVRDADAQAAEALALALDLDDLDPADLAGGCDVGSAVRLLVQAHDVDDPDLLDLPRHQVGRGADDVGQRERLVARQHPHLDPPIREHLPVSRCPDPLAGARRPL